MGDRSKEKSTLSSLYPARKYTKSDLLTSHALYICGTVPIKCKITKMNTVITNNVKFQYVKRLCFQMRSDNICKICIKMYDDEQ
jgi:hypothetical protein